MEFLGGKIRDLTGQLSSGAWPRWGRGGANYRGEEGVGGGAGVVRGRGRRRGGGGEGEEEITQAKLKNGLKA